MPAAVDKSTQHLAHKNSGGPVRAQFGAIYGRLGDFTPAMADIGQELEGRVRDRFRTRADPLGSPWAAWDQSMTKRHPYSGSQAVRQIGKAGNARVLDRCGDLLGSLNWHANKTSVRVGFGLPYALWNEYSTSKMPRRSLLYASPEEHQLSAYDQRHILQAIEQYSLAR